MSEIITLQASDFHEDMSRIHEATMDLMDNIRETDLSLAGTTKRIDHSRSGSEIVDQMDGILTTEFTQELSKEFTTSAALVLKASIETNNQPVAYLYARGIIANLATARALGTVSPSTYEDGGNDVGLVIPRPSASNEISSNGSQVRLRPHQEVTQAVVDGKLVVTPYKGIILHALQAGKNKAPAMIVPTRALLDRLTEHELNVLAEGERFGFSAFDIITRGGKNSTIGPMRYNPLGDDGLLIDLDDTTVFSDEDKEASMVLARMQQLTDDDTPGVVHSLNIVPGNVMFYNNRRTLHGRPSIGDVTGVPIQDLRVLQRTQIA